MSTPSQGRWTRTLALLVTLAIKVGGLVAGLNELLLRPSLRPVALGAITFMMAGAQLSEGLILTVIDRLIGPPTEPPKPEKP